MPYRHDKYDILEGFGPLSSRPATAGHEQLWILTDPSYPNSVIDIQQYRTDTTPVGWISLLQNFIKYVSGIAGDATGNAIQVKAVTGPSPSQSGLEKQLGFDSSRKEIYVYDSGAWKLIGAVATGLGVLQKHNLDPSSIQIANPTTAPTVALGAAGVVNGSYQYKISFVGIGGETLPSPVSATISPISQHVTLSAIPLGNAGTSSRRIYRTQASGAIFYLLTTIGDNTTATYDDNNTDAALDLTTQPSATNTTNAHVGTLSEAKVSFDIIAGHNHDGVNSRKVDYNSLLNKPTFLTAGKPFLRTTNTRAPLIIDPQGPTLAEQTFVVSQIILHAKRAPGLSGFQVTINVYDKSTDVLRFGDTISIPTGTNRVTNTTSTLVGQTINQGDRVEFKIKPGWTPYVISAGNSTNLMKVYDQSGKWIKSFAPTGIPTLKVWEDIAYDGVNYYLKYDETPGAIATFYKFSYDPVANTGALITTITPSLPALASNQSWEGFDVFNGNFYTIMYNPSGSSGIFVVSPAGAVVQSVTTGLPSNLADFVIADGYLYTQNNVNAIVYQFDINTLALVNSFAVQGGGAFDGLGYDGKNLWNWSAVDLNWRLYGTDGTYARTVTPSLLPDPTTREGAVKIIHYNDTPLNVMVL